MRESNFVSFTGNIGSDVELRGGTNGKDVATVSLAETFSRRIEGSQNYEPVHTNWIPVTLFGSLAKRAAKSLKKGERVTVVGSLKTSTYEKEGERRRSFEVIANAIERSTLLDSSRPTGGGGGIGNLISEDLMILAQEE